MNTDITVLIADDHPLIRQGLRQLVCAAPSLKLIAEAEDGERALQLVEELRPQVAVLDVDMPLRDGFAVARRIKALRLPVGLILLTMHRDEVLFNAALDLGINGFVLKESATEEIVSSIRAVAAGQNYVTPLLTDALLKRMQGGAMPQQLSLLSSLTETERRVLKLVAAYKTSKDIGDELFISIRTVDRHRANIATKLNLKGSHALLQFALEHKTGI